MYDRIIAAAMRYSAVVKYAGAVEIPLLPCPQRRPRALPRQGFAADACHLFSGFSALRAQQHPQVQDPHTYVKRPFAPPGTGTFSRPYFQLMHTIIVCF
jgi:hypothetical protein